MAVAVMIAILAPTGSGGTRNAAAPGAKSWPRIAYPSRDAVRTAQRFAAGWGDVSFAVIDSVRGLRGYGQDSHYSAASASKALLLAAELRRLRDGEEPLDGGTRALLESMIVYSDNDAAGGVYARVGDAGLEEVVERARMSAFEVDPGFWGGAQLTAADLARFYWRLEANLAGPHRDYGMRLLSGITESQRWGIPAAAGSAWRIWFKGGWRPAGQEGTTGAVTHQGALLEHKGGQRLAMAVLSNEAPGAGGGYSAIEGVTSRLLEDPPPHSGGWPVP
ncbi:MAG: serine hydrolase [Solirubrobacterales bacterium]